MNSKLLNDHDQYEGEHVEFNQREINDRMRVIEPNKGYSCDDDMNITFVDYDAFIEDERAKRKRIILEALALGVFLFVCIMVFTLI